MVVQFLFFRCHIFRLALENTQHVQLEKIMRIQEQCNIASTEAEKKKSDKKWYLIYLLKHWLPVAPSHQQ